jgi:hypothetical protein
VVLLCASCIECSIDCFGGEAPGRLVSRAVVYAPEEDGDEAVWKLGLRYLIAGDRTHSTVTSWDASISRFLRRYFRVTTL